MDKLTDLIVSHVSKNGITFFSEAPKADGSLPDPLPFDFACGIRIRKMDKS